MDTSSYRFQVGTIECIAVSDGTFTYPSSVFVANEPVETFERELPQDQLPSDEAIATKRRLLDRTAADRLPVFSYHFSFPGLGYVIREGQAWRWQPVDTAPVTAPTAAAVTAPPSHSEDL